VLADAVACDARDTPVTSLIHFVRGPLVDEEVGTVMVDVGEALAEDEEVRRDLVARVFKALSDPSRLKLLEFLAGSDRERTGVECVRVLGRSQGRVSAHLGCLVDCGLVRVRREGRFAYYSVADPRVQELLSLGESVAADHAEGVGRCTEVSVD